MLLYIMRLRNLYGDDRNRFEMPFGKGLGAENSLYYKIPLFQARNLHEGEHLVLLVSSDLTSHPAI
jgi:hypothetical protein